MTFTRILIIFLYFSNAYASYKVKSLIVPLKHSEQIISVEPSHSKVNPKKPRVLRSIPQFLFEDQKPSEAIFQETIIDESLLMSKHKQAMQRPKFFSRMNNIKGEVKVLVDQGPKENRINLTIVGDGYTLVEKEKFFSDAKRIADGLFTGSTFASYLPLFNIYAVFVPSQVSGIGDGAPKGTVLGLYRSPKGSKRGIMCSNTMAARAAVDLAPATDYPILLANDEYYGGLGGEFAISTRSIRSGLIVLRHELGHNFGNVGEEYNGGEVYRGANFSTSRNVPWAHWANNSGIQVFDSENLGNDYPWKNLSTSPVSVSLNMPQGNYRLLAEMSSVGWQTPNDVKVTMDNQIVKQPGPFHDDRAFFTLGPIAVNAGTHTLNFSETVHDNNNVLAYYKLYALPANYDLSPNKIGAFASFSSSNNQVGYRPTHNSCLMNDMSNANFCVVDKENMWHQFLHRVRLIDRISVNEKGDRVVQVETPKLIGLSYSWYKIDQGNEVELPELRGKTTFKLTDGFNGTLRVKVKFVTQEVRKYAPEYFNASEDVIISAR